MVGTGQSTLLFLVSNAAVILGGCDCGVILGNGSVICGSVLGFVATFPVAGVTVALGTEFFHLAGEVLNKL